MVLLKNSNFTVSKPNIEIPNTRKMSEVSAKTVLAKEDIGMRPNSIVLILEEKCIEVTNKAGIAEIRYTKGRNGVPIDVKNIAETNHEPK